MTTSLSSKAQKINEPNVKAVIKNKDIEKRKSRTFEASPTNRWTK